MKNVQNHSEQPDGKKPLRILVTAAGGPAGINTLRLLSEYPHLELYGADIDPHSTGQTFAKEFAVMAPFRDSVQYEADLKRLIKKWEIDVLIPTLADELHAIQSILVGIDVHMVISSEDVTALCADKARFYTWASENFPDYMVKWQTLDKPLGWVSETYFIKPTHGRGSAGCVLMTRDELAEFQKSAEKKSKWIAMEVMPGMEWTVDVYVRRDGVPLYIVPRERIEIVAGISRKGRSVKHSEIIRRTKDILAALPFRGPVCIQWKADERGDPKLLEVNARMSGGIMITVLSGANPMHLLQLELAGEIPEPIEWEEKLVAGYTEYKIL